MLNQLITCFFGNTGYFRVTKASGSDATELIFLFSEQSRYPVYGYILFYYTNRSGQCKLKRSRRGFASFLTAG